jgi:mutator protein MutT
MSDGIIKVVCAIIERDGRILAAQRTQQQYQAGLWEFPGGKVLEGESPQEALRRELKEELAVEVAIGLPAGMTMHDYGERVIELAAFTARIIKGEPQPLDHSELRWVTSSEALQLSWAPADQPILATYLGSLRKEEQPGQ